MRMRWTSFALTLTLACSGDDGGANASAGDEDTTSGDDAPQVCEPGDTRACTCIDGAMGEQECVAEGHSYGECECPDPSDGGATDTASDDGGDTSTSTTGEGETGGGEPGVEWTRTYNGPANSSDIAFGVAVDPADGTIVVVGSITASSGNFDGWVRKYSPTGGIVWTDTYVGASGRSDAAQGVAVDSMGNIAVVGWAQTGGPDNNLWVRMYDADGVAQWTDVLGASEGYGVAFDGAGDLVTVGEQDTALLVQAYAKDGARGFSVTDDGPDMMGARGRAIATDSAGAIVVVGSHEAMGQGADILVRKLDADGMQLWTQTHTGAFGADDLGWGVAIDAMDNVLVAGQVKEADDNQDAWVRVYDTDGMELWTQTADGMSMESDAALAIAAGPMDEAFAAGEQGAGVEGANIWIERYDVAGMSLWSDTVHTGSQERAHGIAMAPDDGFVVVGRAWNASEADNVWVRKFAPM